MFRIIAITALTLLLSTQSKADVTYTYEGMSAQLNLSGLYDAIGSPSETSLINGWTASGNSVNSYDVVIPNPLDERFTLVELLILDAKAQAFLHQTIWGGDDQYHNFLFGAGGYLSMGSVTPVGDQLEFTVTGDASWVLKPSCSSPWTRRMASSRTPNTSSPRISTSPADWLVSCLTPGSPIPT